MNHPLALDRTLVPIARRDHHRAFAIADRVDRRLQRAIAAAGFGDGEACTWPVLREQGGDGNGPNSDERYTGQKPAWQTRGRRDEGRNHGNCVGLDG